MRVASRLLLIAVMLLVASTARSGDDKDLRALIAKAIRARDGAQDEGKYNAITMKGAGTFYGLGEGIPYTAEWHFQGQKQMRFTLEIKVMDQTLTVMQVVNGDKGWSKLNNEVKDMPKDELAEEQESMHATWASTLAPLKDKSYKLAVLGEVKVEGKDAVGVRVSHEGRRDVNLFFDKAGGLLVKVEQQVKDVKGGGDREMTQETFYDDYKEFGGVKHPAKITIKREGKLFVDATMTEVRPVEKLEDSVFAKP